MVEISRWYKVYGFLYFFQLPSSNDQHVGSRIGLIVNLIFYTYSISMVD